MVVMLVMLVGEMTGPSMEEGKGSWLWQRPTRGGAGTRLLLLVLVWATGRGGRGRRR